nr:LysR family transcriptional regulator [Agrobacterium vitis]
MRRPSSSRFSPPAARSGGHEQGRTAVKFDDIEAFISVVRRQSLSHAAQSMALTQSAISRRIQNFEEDLGLIVLDRNSKPPRPTPMGLRVYDQCLKIAREMEKLRALVSGSTPLTGGLRLGMTQAICDLSLHDVLRLQKKNWPVLDVQVITGWANYVVDHVKNGTIDAGVVLMPARKSFSSDVVVTPLAHCEMAVVAAKGFGQQRSYRLADVYQHGWILNPDGCGFRAELGQSLAAGGLPLKINLDTFARETQLEMVAEGYGLGLVPKPLLARSIHRERIEILPISDFSPSADLWLVCAPELGGFTEPVQSFAEIAASIFRPVGRNA